MITDYLLEMSLMSKVSFYLTNEELIYCTLKRTVGKIKLTFWMETV